MHALGKCEVEMTYRSGRPPSDFEINDLLLAEGVVLVTLGSSGHGDGNSLPRLERGDGAVATEFDRNTSIDKPSEGVSTMFSPRPELVAEVAVIDKVTRLDRSDYTEGTEER